MDVGDGAAGKSAPAAKAAKTAGKELPAEGEKVIDLGGMDELAGLDEEEKKAAEAIKKMRASTEDAWEKKGASSSMPVEFFSKSLQSAQSDSRALVRWVQFEKQSPSPARAPSGGIYPFHA